MNQTHCRPAPLPDAETTFRADSRHDRPIAKTEVRHKNHAHIVSTAFIGGSMGTTSGDEPGGATWETKVFGGEHHGKSVLTTSIAWRAWEAMQAHAEMVLWISDPLNRRE